MGRSLCDFSGLWISAVITVERGWGYESILRSYKPACTERKGKKPKRTVAVICLVLLTQSQEYSVYFRGPGPGPERENQGMLLIEPGKLGKALDFELSFDGER